MAWRSFNREAAQSVMREATHRGFRYAADAILEVAKSEVPHDEGTLMNSGTVVDGPEPMSVIISFGGGAGTGHPRVPYAVRWHENSANFQKGRKNRYLADPLYERGPEAVRRGVRAAADELIGGAP